MAEVAGLEPGGGIRPQKTPAEKLEGIAFTFCKVATVALLAGRFTLPVAAGLAATLYVIAYVKGKRDTRCVLRYPLLIAPFWGLIAVLSLALILNPAWAESLRKALPWH